MTGDVWTCLRVYVCALLLERTQILGFVGTAQGVIEVLAPDGK